MRGVSVPCLYWQKAPPARRRRDRVTSATFLRGKRCYHTRELPSHHILASLSFARGSSRTGSVPVSAASPGLVPTAALCAGSPDPVSAGRGRAPHPSPAGAEGEARAAPGRGRDRGRDGDGAGRSRPPRGGGTARYWLLAPRIQPRSGPGAAWSRSLFSSLPPSLSPSPVPTSPPKP